MQVTLNSNEIATLLRQVPDRGEEGGFDGLVVSLASRLDRGTGALELTPEDLERIPRYAFDYRQGGWQERLQGAFGRSLGAKLGR
jgi:hypothetical protein